MGSPTATLPSPQLGLQDTEVPADRMPLKSYRTKRCRNDAQGSCPYGDSCSFVHAPPKLTIMPPPPFMSYPPCYAYPAPLMRDAILVGAPPLYVPMSGGEMHHVEASLQRMAIEDACRQAPPEFPPPPPTPASTATDISSPQSFASVHLSGPDSARSHEEQRSPRRRTNSGGSFYRTKPCKFFHTKGYCVKGNRCNFIHDQTQAAPRREPSEQRAKSPDASSPTGSSRRRRAAKKARAEDEERHDNYYPIMWRVIGGGVMMGGHREVCPAYLAGACAAGADCTLAHPVDDDDSASTPPCFEPAPFAYSPLSPLYLNPFVHYQPAPLYSVLDRPASHVAPAAIDAPKAREPPVVLDGSTLLPREPPAGAVDEDKTPSPPAVPTEQPLIAARTIARPMSTPPALTASFNSNLRLFHAEMEVH